MAFTEENTSAPSLGRKASGSICWVNKIITALPFIGSHLTISFILHKNSEVTAIMILFFFFYKRINYGTKQTNNFSKVNDAVEILAC